MSIAVYSHGRPTVRAVGGMVSSAHPLASAAGAKMLEAGGNAFDAIVATAAVLNVAEPFMSGLAGIGCATLYTAKNRKVRVLDFYTPVPSAFDARKLSALDIREGANASGTPGSLAGWCKIASELGSLPLATLLAPAIRHARQGIPVSPFFTAMVGSCRGRNMQPEWLSTYIAPTENARAGTILKQPDLAETLEAIAADGPSYLYGGPLGRKMVAHLRTLGGCINEDDLATAEATWQEPVATNYRGLDIHVPSPPAESFQFLLTMKLLQGFDIAALEHLSADHLDLVFRATRLAAEARIRNNKCSRERVEELLSEDHAAPLRDRLRDPAPITGRTEQYGDGPLPEVVKKMREHTTSFSAIDRDGNAICLTQTLGSMFGSGVVIPGTGVTMNNFMNWGDLNPDSPNHLVAGTRRAMCVAPSLSLKDGAVVLALGTPGSYGILQTQAQAMVHHLDYGLDLQAAIDAPRARLWDGTKVNIEARVEEPVLEELKGRGHEVGSIAPFSMECGGVHAISRDPETGILTGAADSRREGAAIAI